MTASSSPKKFSAAIRKGDVVAVRAALSAGLDPGREIEVDGFRDLPLQYAVEQTQARIVEVLLRAGAPPDGTDSTLVTPLHGAAINGDVGIARLLVDAGADIHRESLTQPLTPTGAAEYWSFQGQGQKDIAAYLRSLGGTNPYNDPNRPETLWDGHVGEWPIRLVEKTLDARVSPESYVRGSGAAGVPLYSCRFDRKKWLFRLLFTAHLSPKLGYELAVALPGRWPVHRAALEHRRFAWPLDVVAHLARGGLPLRHGGVASRAALGDSVWLPPPVSDFVAVAFSGVESVRAGLAKKDPEFARHAGPLLLLVPRLSAKKPLDAAAARAFADAKASVKWGPSALKPGRSGLAIPLELSAEDA
jgi:hypothetical protein